MGRQGTGDVTSVAKKGDRDPSLPHLSCQRLRVCGVQTQRTLKCQRFALLGTSLWVWPGLCLRARDDDWIPQKHLLLDVYKRTTYTTLRGATWQASKTKEIRQFLMSIRYLVAENIRCYKKYLQEHFTLWRFRKKKSFLQRHSKNLLVQSKTRIVVVCRTAYHCNNPPAYLRRSSYLVRTLYGAWSGQRSSIGINIPRTMS